MQCPNCGKSGFVAINGKRFCSNCGSTVAAASATPTMSEIGSANKTLDLRSDQAIQDAVAAKPLPAGQLHGRQVAGAALRDIRPKPSSPPTAAVPVPALPVAPPPIAPVPAVAVAPATPPPPALSPAQTATTPSQPVPAVPALDASLPSPSSIPRSPYIQKLPPNPALSSQSQPNPLPNAVAANIEGLSSMTPAPAPVPPVSSELQQALKAAKHSSALPNITKVAAAIGAIGIMSGLIWLQNAPKLAFNNAAAKAGINASLPTYIPSSYRQTGPTTTSSGRISINFASTTSQTPLSIVQRRTNWDSNSLRENYVSQQTSDFLAVQGQGLVIYLDDDQANWVNHGVWYQIVGTSKLGREQVLKIAYGL